MGSLASGRAPRAAPGSMTTGDGRGSLARQAPLACDGCADILEQLAVGLAPAGSARVADSYTVDVPVALRIDFAAGPAWMVAGIPKAPEMQEVFVPGDEIMVVFSAERMRQIGFPGLRLRDCQPGLMAPTSKPVRGRSGWSCGPL